MFKLDYVNKVFYIFPGKRVFQGVLSRCSSVVDGVSSNKGESEKIKENNHTPGRSESVGTLPVTILPSTA